MKEAKQARRQGKAQPMNPAGREGNPVSLAPLNFEEALSNLLQVPPSKVKEAEQPKKRTAKKRAK